MDRFPAGLIQRLKLCIENENIGDNDYATKLYNLRMELERFVEHLVVLAKVKDNEMPGDGINNKIQHLAGKKIGLLKEGVEHYLSFWYGLGCLGSHYKSASSEKNIEFKQHYNMCKEAMITALSWYIKEFPPISQKSDFIENTKITLEKFKGNDFDKFVKPSHIDINMLLEKKDVILLDGLSWIGKTSLSCLLVDKLFEKGFIPVLFHQNTLLNFSLINNSNISGLEDIKKLSLSEKAGALHKEIVTSIFRGDSCVILFDDAFGHRSFKPYSSPLSYLRLVDWINLAQRNTSLGKLKIIINTPTKFLIELKTQDLSEASPILRENLDWLFQIGNSSINQISLNLNNYSFKDIAKIVSNISSSLGCKWSNDSEICELFAQIVEQSCNSFDTLRLFCLESRDLEVNDKKLLDLAERYLERSLELFQEIQDLDSNIKVFLIAVIIGEIFVQLSKDYMYYSKISFDELCQYLGITNLLLEQSKSQNLLYWLNFDLNNNLDTQSFPRFRHPDIRAAFDIWSLSENGKKMISEIISSSVFLKVFTNSKITAIMRWESIYLLCRLGHFLNNEICEYVDEKWFRLSKTAFDYRNTLWAITDNFIYIKDSLFEKYAVAALKRIQNEEHSLRRNFIWEIMNNWSYMNEEIRYFVLKLNCQENRKDEKIILKPQMSEHHFIAFLGASLCNYRTINKLANDNKSQASKDCLDFINTFVSELSKSNNIDKAQYKGHEDDGIFNDRGAMYPGREVLQRVRKIGLEYGGLEENLQIVKNIDAALS